MDLESALVEIVIDHLVLVAVSTPDDIDDDVLARLLGRVEERLLQVDDDGRRRLAHAMRAGVAVDGTPEQRDVVHDLIREMHLEG